MLETKWLYLILNAFTISFPLIRSFESKVAYYKGFPSLFKSMAIVSGFFLVWDIWFTEMGVWGFTPEYLSGIALFGLPLGEYLFFITVPFACLFIYECMHYFSGRAMLKPAGVQSMSQLFFCSFVPALGAYSIVEGLWYTGSTFVLLGLFTAYAQYVVKAKWLPRFYESYLPCLVPIL